MRGDLVIWRKKEGLVVGFTLAIKKFGDQYDTTNVFFFLSFWIKYILRGIVWSMQCIKTIPRCGTAANFNFLLVNVLCKLSLATVHPWLCIGPRDPFENLRVSITLLSTHGLWDLGRRSPINRMWNLKRPSRAVSNGACGYWLSRGLASRPLADGACISEVRWWRPVGINGAQFMIRRKWNAVLFLR